VSSTAPLFGEEKNYYELLELTPDASAQEIREAYHRIRNAYRPDSVALYSLLGEDETSELLEQVESAFQVLSHPDRRREYDRNHGTLKVFSIDRVPPMENNDTDHLLIAPVTAFDATPIRGRRSTDASPTRENLLESTPAPTESFFDTEPQGEIPAPSHNENHWSERSTPLVLKEPPAPLRPKNRTSGQYLSDSPELIQEIESQTEWRGEFLKKIREARSISIDELSSFTKVSKNYLVAIENEAFQSLPAPVFLRGFVTQIAKYLRLRPEGVVQAYMNRVQEFQKSQKK
jgi:hypothetical protein